MNRGEAPLACGCSHRDQQKGTRGIRAIVAPPVVLVTLGWLGRLGKCNHVTTVAVSKPALPYECVVPGMNMKD